MISPTQRPLPDNTQHLQETNIHGPGGIRTHNPRKRAAADPRLRQRGHWDWPIKVTKNTKSLRAVVEYLDPSVTQGLICTIRYQLPTQHKQPQDSLTCLLTPEHYSSLQQTPSILSCLYVEVLKDK